MPSGSRPTVSSVRARSTWPASTVPSTPTAPASVGVAASAPRPTGRHPPAHAPSRSPAPPPNGTISPMAGTNRVSRWRLPNSTTAASARATSTVPGDQAAGSTSMWPRTGTAVTRRVPTGRPAGAVRPPPPTRSSVQARADQPADLVAVDVAVADRAEPRHLAPGGHERAQAPAGSTARPPSGGPGPAGPPGDERPDAPRPRPARSAWGTTAPGSAGGSR